MGSAIRAAGRERGRAGACGPRRREGQHGGQGERPPGRLRRLQPPELSPLTRAAAMVPYLRADYAGALTASWFSPDPRRGLQLSLIGVALTTLAMAWIGSESVALIGAVLRAGAVGACGPWLTGTAW